MNCRSPLCLRAIGLLAAVVMLTGCSPTAGPPEPEHDTQPAPSVTLRVPTTQMAPRTLDQIHLRDPCILPVRGVGRYYMVGTATPPDRKPGFNVYESSDLVTWTGPGVAFTRPEGFWADHHYWAPEIHPYRGKYYMLASFKAENACRATQILVSDHPSGPYEPHGHEPQTPRDWECLDGTLFIDERDQPWMVFCHEWVQVGDGEICAMKLSHDLKRPAGEPFLLFRASQAAWTQSWPHDGREGIVTDGPYFHRADNGHLLMIWSSFGRTGYTTGVARSVSGRLEGPWTQDPEPLFSNDGGHGMFFRRFDGQLMLVLHQPNKGPLERPRLFEVRQHEGILAISPWPAPGPSDASETE